MSTTVSQPDFKVQSSEFKVQCSSFADRLLSLCDGRPGLRGTMHIEVREPSLASSGGEGLGEEALNSIRENSCNSCLDFTSSDETLDRYGEIIQATGWKLSSYQRNPVFQNAHQYGDVIFTLAEHWSRRSAPANSINAF